MAVIQISKMQVRRGQTALTGFPQLSSGEFGWSIDTQELYIGNGAVSEGAPAVGNTQIITEHNINNFFKYAENGYQYKDDPRARYRTIQDKLDDELNLNDIIDVTTSSSHADAIQLGIDIASKDGRPLIIPEYNYVIDKSIKISSNVELRGAGPGKTVITNTGTASTFITVDGAGIGFGDASYGNNRPPKNIRISGFSFVNNALFSQPIMQLDCVSDSIIEGCNFVGDETNVVPTDLEKLATAINFRDKAQYPSNLTKNITIRDCSFNKLNAAILSNHDISDILIEDNKFYQLNEGVTLGKTLSMSTGSVYGPQHVIISQNKFDTINKQAIYVGSTSTVNYSDINSVDNYFYRVGNLGQGDGTSNQVHEVIRFGTFGNYSSGDTFDRLNKLNLGSTYLAPNSTATTKSVVSGPVTLTSKGPLVYNIIGESITPIFVFPRSTYQYSTNAANQIITIDYTINKPDVSLIRKGTLDIIVSGTTSSLTDSYSTNNVIEGEKITFLSEVSTSRNLVIVKQNNQSSAKGNIIYTYTVRQ